MSNEARRIKSILELVKRLPATAADGRLPSTGLSHLDDCAVIPISNNLDLVVGSDFVRGEGFHLFKLGQLSWKDVGYYVIAANASDLAAMGATPTGVLVVFRTRASMSEVDYNCAMEGVVEDMQGSFPTLILWHCFSANSAPLQWAGHTRDVLWAGFLLATPMLYWRGW